jgi:sarcosine oxidase, subunit delta
VKILKCPLNGPRNITEFVWGGEMKPMPDPATATDAEWTEYLFLEENLAGEITEWWLHAPTNYWFIARNTITDEIIETMTYDAFLARQQAASAAAAPGEAEPAAKSVTGGADTGATST